MHTIRSLRFRRVLNSHVQFTNEFILQLEDGSTGRGASSQGETISIYEDKKVSIDPQTIIDTMRQDGLLGTPLDQATFDCYLEQHFTSFGRNNAFGLSEAYFNASSKTEATKELFGEQGLKPTTPRLCLNILNGGWHAYTNPVLSDFSEFMLVARSSRLEDVIPEHNAIQQAVREKLNLHTKVVISGNPVNCFTARDNRAVIEFLLGIVADLGLAEKYDLMIDASAGDLWDGQGYTLGITDGKTYSSREFGDYWTGIMESYPLRFLEDPFHEQDFTAWRSLTTGCDGRCTIIGDNLYSSSSARITEGAANRYAHAAVIKPNQAGTVSAVLDAIRTAKDTGQIAISSHRSISTESTFLATLTCLTGVPFIKIGPLASDYSSIVRLNEIIRLTEADREC